MARYPLVIRNRIPWFVRGFMLFWLGGVAAFSWISLTSGAPTAERWWPWVLALFWVVGLSGTWYALRLEAAEIRIPGPRSIHIRRGPAFARSSHWIDKATLHIEETVDSEGDPYFRLLLDAPGGPLAVAEGHRRLYLEEQQRRIETAVAGRATRSPE